MMSPCGVAVLNQIIFPAVKQGLVFLTGGGGGGGGEIPIS